MASKCLCSPGVPSTRAKQVERFRDFEAQSIQIRPVAAGRHPSYEQQNLSQKGERVCKRMKMCAWKICVGGNSGLLVRCHASTEGESINQWSKGSRGGVGLHQCHPILSFHTDTYILREQQTVVLETRRKKAAAATLYETGLHVYPLALTASASIFTVTLCCGDLRLNTRPLPLPSASPLPQL